MKVEIDLKLQIATIDVGKLTEVQTLMDAVIELLAHPDHVDGMESIFDFSQADLSSITQEDLDSYARWLSAYVPRLAARVATVVSGDLEFGIVRMWHAHSEELATQERMIFRDIDKAREWLLSGR